MTSRGPLVIVGDTLLDVDIDGPARRLSPDAPVPVVEGQQQRYRAGGAGLAAVLAAVRAGPGGPGVILVTALGDDPAADRLRELLGAHVEVLGLPLQGATVSKVRIRACGQPVVRLDTGDGRAAPGPAGPAIRAALLGAGAVLVSDYGRGITAHPELAGLLGRLPAAVPVVWDPHPAGQSPAATARLVTPNRAEARNLAAALGAETGPPATGGPAAQAARDAGRLARKWGTAVAVTLGEVGAVLSSGDGLPVVVPAPELPPAMALDTCGAGDAFAAAAALALRSGGLLPDAVAEAVAAATGFVASGGAGRAPGSGPSGPDGLAGLASPPARAASLASPPPWAASRPARAGGAPAPAGTGWDVVAGVRARGGRVVATGGCFDLLHAGHVSLLREARRLGDCLIVCLNSDSSVAGLKGPGRPLVGEEDRAAVLGALAPVDGVIVFAERTPSALLERLRPDVWVKGGDYGHADLAEAEVVRRHGGEVMLLPYLSHHSTSQIVAAARSAPGSPRRAPAGS